MEMESDHLLSSPEKDLLKMGSAELQKMVTELRALEKEKGTPEVTTLITGRIKAIGDILAERAMDPNRPPDDMRVVW